MNPVWKLNFFLFNIEGYGEFFSGITPKGIKLYVHKVPDIDVELSQIILK